MDYLVFFLRICLSTLFISSSWSKLHKIEEHIAIIKEYEILPKTWVRWFSWIETRIEITIGILLLIGLFQKVALLFAIFLLIIYSIAITINLLRGKTLLSCGCGGLAGNHQLSWPLLLRNILLVIISFWLFLWNGYLGSIDSLFLGYMWNEVFSFQVTLAIFLSWLMTLLLVISKEFNEIKKRIDKLLEIN